MFATAVSEYDYMFPVLDELRKNNHNIKIVVSGAHLSHNHNNTWKHIEGDGFVISDKIDSLLSTDRLTQRCLGVSMIIAGLTQTIDRENPAGRRWKLNHRVIGREQRHSQENA